MAERASHGPFLEWVDFEGQRHVSPLASGETLAGRDERCQLHFRLLDVSRVHCAFASTAAGWVVRDEGSRFGTWVNGVRLHGEHVLAHGDVIGLGEVGRMTLTYLEHADETISAVVRGRRPREVAASVDAPDRVLWSVLRAMSSTLDLEVVLDVVLDAVLALTRLQRGVLLLDEKGELVEPAGRAKQRPRPGEEARDLARKAWARSAVVSERSPAGEMSWARAAFPLRAFEGNRLQRDHVTGGPRVIGVVVVEGEREGELAEEVALIQQLCDLAAVHVANTQLYERTRHDDLTGLLNRGSFDRDLAEAFDRSLATRHPLAMTLADIDHFKRINDTFGHGAGDTVLQVVARVARETVAGVGGTVYRYGGEEFAILWPSLKVGDAAARTERLRRALEETPIATRDVSEPLRVTISAGVASIPLDGVSRPSEFRDVADRRLYVSKNGGRNRVTPPTSPG